MPSDTVATRGARRAPFRWELGTVYVDFLVALSDHVKREKREDSSFTKTTWSEILVHLSSKGHNVPNWDTLKTKHNTVKKLYREWVALCHASGFERDKETGAVTASDECWAAYLEVRTLLLY
jgi:Myb/SANT-like DNA-binding domain